MALPSEAELRELSPDDKIRLIELLWASFTEDPASLPVTAGQREELRRRVTAHDADPESARPWSEVRAELERE
jgi:putative addiction module component (TIGR02574 family)